jgi:hypothetical protein
MRVVQGYPPNFGKIDEVLHPPAHATYAYGERIYNPSGKEMPPDIILHEEMHRRQQGDNPEAWWDQYLFDPAFRYEQELEAYGAQYAFAKAHGIRGKMLAALLDSMATALSRDYGVDISFGAAASKIRTMAEN